MPMGIRTSVNGRMTYGTAKEFGFDFLRDRLLIRSTDEGDQDLLATMLGQIRQETGDTPIQRDPSTPFAQVQTEISL